MPHHVVALALPGVVAFDLATVGQVFGHASEGEYSFAVAASRREVPTSTGFSVNATATLAGLAEAATVIVPGYRPHDPPARREIEGLRAAAGRGARVASVCTGAFALAAAGLLDGLTATTHWQDAAELQQLYPAVEVDPDVLYLDHGAIATSAGVAAGIDLCLHLVRRDHGEAVAARIARRMVVPPHRDGGQAQYIDRRPVAEASGLASTLAWALSRLEAPLTVDELARHAGLSPRHFARRFTIEVGETPLQWLTHQRVLEVRRLLETSHLPMATIATRTGLGTATTVRRVFLARVGVTPTAYRRTFSPGGG